MKASEENTHEVDMVDFPGGPKAFEICAKFCYGMTVTLNAYNVVAARCAVEYLEMTEYVDRGNLVFKIEVFLNSSILRSWKDSIIVLQTTKSLLPWSENLKIVGRCIDSIALKTSVDPANVTWSYTYNQKLSAPEKIVECAMEFREKIESVPKDWWVEDICEALKTYAARWLPDSVDSLVSDAHSRRNKLLVETIVCLLPSDKGDLLIPAQPPQTTLYDVEMVHSIVNRYMMHEKCGRDLDLGNSDLGCTDFVLGHGTMLRVSKLMDAYLEEIVRDPNLSHATFMDLSQSIPKFARPGHDGLYKAIDIYLKEHPRLTKAERKKLWSDGFQVLYFEQARAAAGVKSLNNNPHDTSQSTTNTEEEWEKTATEDLQLQETDGSDQDKRGWLGRTEVLRHLEVHKARLQWFQEIPSRLLHLQNTEAFYFLGDGMPMC
ncbi:Phototropic-responsive NPH3 family protein isoform 2 [Hibiscus syriacus]|uniref:Phototropic-responsive NPH3 family protein isoform 2 n=1 Tax=Hibiscus syriacus TaxID=106335 RepID=A0A6A3CQ69_HIBSY|nr:Phototropic-responsive NPH3 family protein isoform 2 [Hibiscus syriacus]